MLLKIVSFIVIVIIIYCWYDHKKEIRKKVEACKNTIYYAQQKVQEIKGEVQKTLRCRYQKEHYYVTGGIIYSLESFLRNLNDKYDYMDKTNEELKKISPKEDMSSQLVQLRQRDISYVKNILDKESVITSKKAVASTICLMMDKEHYGKISNDYYDFVSKQDKANVENYILCVKSIIEKVDIDQISKVQVNDLINCAWYYALEKVFDAGKYNQVLRLFDIIFDGKRPVDFWIANVYAKKRIGGEGAISSNVDDFIKARMTSEEASIVSSSLMWMQAYKSECKVLSKMLSLGMDMSPKMQERLHSLENGGGKAPAGLSVDTRNDKVYFDVSALAWGNDEYNGLFENLAFQDTNLNYSLAIRDENKELFVAQGINVPNIDKIIEKINSVIQVEYGTGVVAEKKDCIAVSDGEEEKLQGILVYSNECNQMGILVNVVKIGKKVVIKFYTLFMPVASDLTTQKQQALSIYKKLSPSVTMWESSLKDTMLMAIEQLLNSVTDNGGNIVNEIGQGIQGVTEF